MAGTEEEFNVEAVPELEAEFPGAEEDEDDVAALVHSMMKRDATLLASPEILAHSAGGEGASTSTAAGSGARTEYRPTVTEDFIRNFLIRNGLQRSLDAFNSEWYELQCTGRLPKDDTSTIPDVYTQNEKLQELVQRLRVELGHAQEVAAKAQATWDRFRKERDFHRMHHGRVVQEKNKLLADIKRLKSHYEAYEPTIRELTTKYETAMRERMLLKVDKDRFQARVSAMEAQIKALEENNASGSGGAGGGDASGGDQVIGAMSASGLGRTRSTGPAGRKGAGSTLGVNTKRGVGGAGSAATGSVSGAVGGYATRSGAPILSSIPAPVIVSRNGITPGAADSRLPDDMVNPYTSTHLPRPSPPSAVDMASIAMTKAHGGPVSALAFHPTKPVLVSGSDDTTWRAWAVPSCDLLLSAEGHRSWIADVDFHPQGSHVATCSGDGVIKLWSLSTAACAATFTDHSQTTWSVAFHSAGDFLVSASMDQMCRVYDIHTGKIRQSLRGHADSVNAACWQPFSVHVATGSGDKTVSLWDARTGLCVQTFYGHTNAVHDVCFSLRGDVLASCDADGVVRVWDVRRVAERGHVALGRRAVHSVAFDRSGLLLAAACDDGTVKLLDCSVLYGGTWDATGALGSPSGGGALGSPSASGTSGFAPYGLPTSINIPLVQTLSGHEASVQCVAWDASGTMLASCGNDNSIRLWSEPGRHSTSAGVGPV